MDTVAAVHSSPTVGALGLRVFQPQPCPFHRSPQPLPCIFHLGCELLAQKDNPVSKPLPPDRIPAGALQYPHLISSYPPFSFPPCMLPSPDLSRCPLCSALPCLSLRAIGGYTPVSGSICVSLWGPADSSGRFCMLAQSSQCWLALALAFALAIPPHWGAVQPPAWCSPLPTSEL
jgi:hypothetical protein